MKRDSIKKMAFTILVGIVSVVAVGCTSNTTSTSASGSISTGTTDITMLLQWGHLYEANNYCEQLVESEFPVKILMERIDNSNTEQVRALLDAKTPDFFTVLETPAYVKDNEYVRTIPIEMVREYAPSLMKYFDDYPLLYTSVLNKDDPTQFDALIGIDETSTRIALYADMYRYDWILESGIDLGTEVVQITDNYYVAKEGLTKETFEEIMDYFVNGDPDQNGVDDTAGASLYGGATLRTSLTSGFGIIPDINESNGEAAQYYAMPEYKELAIWCADLYSRGLIDEEWFTQDALRARNKVEVGKSGFWQSSTNALNAWAVGRPPITLIRENPNVKLLLTTGLQDDSGNVTMQYSSTTMQRNYFYVGEQVTDEKLALILQIYEYCNFSEASMELWFGEEGVDWQYNAAGEFELLNELDIAEKGVKVFAQDTQIGELWEAITLEEDFLKGAEFWLDDGSWIDDYVYPYKEDLRKESNYGGVLGEKGDHINSVVSTYFEAWVTGEKDVSATWSEYLTALEVAGYNELIEELELVPTLQEMREEYQ